jgi:hypothetical protein
MSESRRHFIKGSLALSLLTVSNASAQAGKQIGIVHSATWGDGDPLEACFKQGLEDQNWTPTSGRRAAERGSSRRAIRPLKPVRYRYEFVQGQYGGQYGGTFGQDGIAAAIKKLGTVDLVVAAGGNISAQAAADANVKFLFLIGVMPPNGFGAGALGGVNLDTASQGQHQARINAFTSIADKSKIYLVQNYNSAMADQEAKTWQGLKAGPIIQFFKAGNPSLKNPADVKDAIAASINNIPADAQGIVISADPLFRDLKVRGHLAKACSNLKGVSVCYPFKDYVASHPGATWLGPPLASTNSAEIKNTAYYGLGVKTGKYLNGNGGNVGTSTWDGTNNRWDTSF